MPFCFIPFMHRRVDTQAQNRPCCSWRWKDGDYDLQKWDGKDYQNIRKSLLNNPEWLPECGDCKNREESGAESLRQAYNLIYEELGRPQLNFVNGTNLQTPISYDLGFNNLCNLSCRMCGPKFSLQIQKEAKKHPALWPHWPDVHKDYSSKYDLDIILDNVESVNEFKFLGGEPTLQPETQTILKRLVEVGHTNFIKIFITTNGTNANHYFFNLLTQFKKVDIQFSIDAYGAGHEYIRGPASNFKKIWENVNKISELNWAGEVNFEINQTVQVFNIFDFWRLRQEVSHKFKSFKFRNFIVYTPEFHSPSYIPDKWKDKAKKIAINEGVFEDEKHIFNEIYKYDYKPDAMKALAANTHLMDPVRNQFLKDYYPLCYEMLEEIK